MKELFLPYKESLELKELGFDEPCLAVYYSHKPENLFFAHVKKSGKMLYQHNSFWTSPLSGVIVVPTYQQVFRWFREKYKLHSFIDCKWKNLGWEFELVDLSKMETISSIDRYNYKTPEETELACIRKLIEITKQQKQ